MNEVSIPALATKIASEHDAYLFMEQLRWGKDNAGLVCPHCAHDRAYYLKPSNGTARKTRTGSASERRVWKCASCRKQFSVLNGTIFHGTKVPLRTWLFVVFEMCASKNGVSAREVERKYDLTPKTAWFMLHRIREAMKREPLAGMLSGTVIADETFIGGREKNKHKAHREARRVPEVAEPTKVVPGERPKRGAGGGKGKTAVLSLIDAASGEIRSVVVPDVTGATLRKAMAEQVNLPATALHTDEGKGYKIVAPELAAHRTVNHSDDEYVRYVDGEMVTTNHAEGYFSQLKRSIDGTHHHVSTEHLPRYLAEFDYRYTTREMNDTQRMGRLFGQVAGRRLTYRRLA